MIEEESKELTGVGVEKSLKLAKHLDERNIPVWIRHVLLPGITDKDARISRYETRTKWCRTSRVRKRTPSKSCAWIEATMECSAKTGHY